MQSARRPVARRRQDGIGSPWHERWIAGRVWRRGEHRDGRRAILLALFLFTVAFALRVATFGLVFVDGRVWFPSGNDELYHIRRIAYQAARFPEVLDFDPYLSFPFGARPIWPPFLDWLLAGVVASLRRR